MDLGVENGTNRNHVPTFLFDFYADSLATTHKVADRQNKRHRRNRHILAIRIKTVEACVVLAPPEPNSVKETRSPFDTFYYNADLNLSFVFNDHDFTDCDHFGNDVALNAASKSSSDEYYDIEQQHEGVAASVILAKEQKARPTLAECWRFGANKKGNFFVNKKPTIRWD